METTKNASSSAFEQINKNLINNVRGKKYLECLGAYCWMKSNAVFTESFDIAIGQYRRETLHKNEISYSLNYLAKAWGITDDKVSSILKEMEKFDMIKQVRAIKGLTKGVQYVYKVNDKFLFCENKLAESDNQLAENTNQLAESDNQLAENTNQLAESDNQLAENTNQLAESDNQLAENTNRLAESSMNNNTNNNTNKETIKEKKKDTNSKDTCLPFQAKACGTNEGDDFDQWLEATSVDREKDVESLDDKAYYKKYGKTKPIFVDKTKDRLCDIKNELYMYMCQLKKAGKVFDERAIKTYMAKSKYAPSVEEIDKAKLTIGIKK